MSGRDGRVRAEEVGVERRGFRVMVRVEGGEGVEDEVVVVVVRRRGGGRAGWGGWGRRGRVVADWGG